MRLVWVDLITWSVLIEALKNDQEEVRIEGNGNYSRNKFNWHQKIDRI